ncbi:hypothetical protein SUGI_1040720 [Cryptomeria japonica]|nr:hypothetical protein SUGI_1040720 [Cryptomeria japonica]
MAPAPLEVFAPPAMSTDSTIAPAVTATPSMLVVFAPTMVGPALLGVPLSSGARSGLESSSSFLVGDVAALVASNGSHARVSNDGVLTKVTTDLGLFFIVSGWRFYHVAISMTSHPPMGVSLFGDFLWQKLATVHAITSILG